MAKFHNPYNFIPSLSRITGSGKQRSVPLGDAAPVGHHAYLPDLWSGTIQLQITAETPLLLADASRATAKPLGGGRQHVTYGTRVGLDGRPVLPLTSVKGMLRTAYEAITNSRFGVLGSHADRLAYRMDAREGIRMIPAMVTPTGIDLLLGTTNDIPVERAPGEWEIPGRVMYAAWLPRYKAGTPGNAASSPAYPGGARPGHGDDVWFWAERVKHLSRRQTQQGTSYEMDFEYWSVRSIAPNRATLDKPPAGLPAVPLPYQGRSVHVPSGELLEANGKVFISNQNIKSKHDERVFFAKGPGHRVPVPLSPTERVDLVREWRTLILGAREGREEEVFRRTDTTATPAGVAPPDKYLGNKPGQTAWSRHMYAPGVDSMPLDSLCYAAIRHGANASALSAVDIDALVPVQISRRLFEAAPRELFGERSGRRPAATLSQLSPADRVFGWVNASGAGAHRGLLRVRSCICTTPREEALSTFVPAPLAILGNPKPQQGRFYAASASDGTPMEGAVPKGSLYQPGKGLRGRKVYLHQQLPDGYWRPDADPEQSPGVPWTTREFLRYGYDADSQNRSISSWVNPKTKFTVELQVTNLADVELGALLWLLTRPANHFLRVGGAKPLGFGSVHVAATSANLGDGRFWQAYYRSLDPAGPAGAELARLQAKRLLAVDSKSLESVVGSFETAVTAYAPATADVSTRFESTPFIKAFLRAAVGVPGPVHYPRATPTPDPEGENFKWFVGNERDASRRHSLPSLLETDDERLKLPFFAD